MNSNWSYSPETKSWVVTSVTLTFDLWPWPFAWTLPWSNVITPENFMMIRWWEHCQKGVTDGQTDRQTDGRTDRRTENTIHRAAWSQLKMEGSLAVHSWDKKDIWFWCIEPVTFLIGHLHLWKKRSLAFSLQWVMPSYVIQDLNAQPESSDCWLLKTKLQ